MFVVEQVYQSLYDIIIITVINIMIDSIMTISIVLSKNNCENERKNDMAIITMSVKT